MAEKQDEAVRLNDPATSGNGNCVLSVSGLNLSFSNRTILNDIELSFAAGEFTGIIGPNGSGKTSLLRVLDGIYRPERGRILLEGRELSSYKPKERARRIAFMMQGDSGAITFPVLDVVLSGRYPHGRSGFGDSKEDLDRSREALSRVGLPDIEDRGFETLSTGEQQLVLFARVLVQDTRVILLDEPTSNLDLPHLERIFNLAEELSREGRTVIASIHAINEASRRCSRLVLLNGGKVAADGEPAGVMKPEILDRAFDVRTTAVDDPVTGAREIRVLPAAAKASEERIVHIVGGGGSSVELTRFLNREGFRLTGSPVPETDPDAIVWKALGIPFVPVPPFAAPGMRELERERKFLREAGLVAMCLPAVTAFYAPVLHAIGESSKELITFAADTERILRALGVPEERITPSKGMQETKDLIIRRSGR